MASEALKFFIALATNDKAFLQRLLVDPATTAQECGCNLTEEEIKAIRQSQPGQTLGEELERRVNGNLFRKIWYLL